MSVVLPAPVPLPLPPGNAEGLAELRNSLTGAAFCAGVLRAHLAGPAVDAPDWLGADATAAAEQMGRTAALLTDVHEALTSAADRVAGHAHLLQDALGRIRTLRAAQGDDFAQAAARLTALGGGYGAYGLGGPGGQAVLEELGAAERDRARRHAAVLDDVARDAADTGRVLCASAAAVGGSGAPGDGGRVLSVIASRLPGWGEGELSALAGAGADVGARLRQASPEALLEELTEHRLQLSAPVFAAALIRAIGPDVLRAFVDWAGLAVRPDQLPALLGRVMGAADAVAAGDAGLRRTLDAPLDGSMDAFTAVGLGRVVGAAGFTGEYRRRVVVGLAAAEHESPWLRRDELEVAPADDPLTSAVAALAAAEEPDAAAAALDDDAVWSALLHRRWADGTAPLEALIDAAAASEHLGGAAANTALDVIGAGTDPLMGIDLGPEAVFVVGRISPALGRLVAAHLDQVAAPVASAEGCPGVPSAPLDGEALRRLTGLGTVTRDHEAREAILRTLVRSMGDRLPAPEPGMPAPAAFVTGGVFAAMAFGEQQSIRVGLYSAEERAAADATAWTILTSALDLLPVGRLGRLRDMLSAGVSFVGPGGLPIEAFLAQPATGAFQASFAAAAATVPGLVAAGDLPDPGTALDRGLGTTAARAYEASLSPGERDLWERVVTGAQSGYLTVGDGLGILPGSTYGGTTPPNR